VKYLRAKARAGVELHGCALLYQRQVRESTRGRHLPPANVELRLETAVIRRPSYEPGGAMDGARPTAGPAQILASRTFVRLPSALVTSGMTLAMSRSDAVPAMCVPVTWDLPSRRLHVHHRPPAYRCSRARHGRLLAGTRWRPTRFQGTLSDGSSSHAFRLSCSVPLAFCRFARCRHRRGALGRSRAGDAANRGPAISTG
jgi:hypothetical protein